MTIFNNFNSYKNKTALIIGNNEKITYQDLIQKRDKFAKNLNNRCLVFLITSNSVSCITAYVGLIKAGCAIAFIDENINQKTLCNLINLYKPGYICLNDSKKIDNIEYKLSSSFFEYSLLCCKDYLKNNISDDLFLLMSTSGSTGSPKFVRQHYQ